MPQTEQARDYYERLGVSPEASQDEIRKAYLKLARKYHPDKTGGDKPAEEKLKAINDAYDTLKNPEKRKAYDGARANPFGASAGFGGGAQHGGFGGPGGGFEFHADSFEDLFGGIFGGGGRAAHSRAKRPGNDLEVPLTVTLREVEKGAKKTIRINAESICDPCHGTGAKSGTQPQPCPQCGGSGQDSRSTGAFFMARPCARCRGTGQINPSPCGACNGSGVVRKPRTVAVNIPAGVESGMRLRLAGQGDAGESGAPSGDLYVHVDVALDPRFERQGANLTCEVPVAFADAALGAKIRVPTLHGEANLTIPAGTQPGQTLRMRGLGLPNPGGLGKGDQLVRVKVSVPKHLTPEQRAAIEKLRS